MTPKPGDTVRVHYTGTLSDGTQFDSSAEREPLEFEVGSGQVIPGFDEAVTGLGIGEHTTVTIAARDAYGERIDEAVRDVPIDLFENQAPEVGWTVEMQAPDGSRMAAVITSIDDATVTLDFNHPLAGEDLTFEIELVEIVDGGPKLIIP